MAIVLWKFAARTHASDERYIRSTSIALQRLVRMRGINSFWKLFTHLLVHHELELRAIFPKEKSQSGILFFVFELNSSQ